ncbi:MAG: hypothetical protein Q7S38_01610 [bacterium]|nr:hypothetical protein [bacterium]
MTKSVESGGMRLSRETASLVHRAQRLGVDPSGIIDRASEVARNEGRNKVGGFGEAAIYVNQLREAVGAIETNIYLREIRNKNLSSF